MEETNVIIRGRQVQKHDIEANWIKAGDAENPFIPKNGEIIIYDPDDNYSYARMKISDGTTIITSLPFTLDVILSDAKAYIDDAILNGEW